MRKFLEHRILVALALVIGAAGIACAEPQVRSGILMTPVTAIYPGDEITAEMVAPQSFRFGGSSENFARSLEDVVGRIARRTLMRGQPIPLSALREKAAVLQGKTYSMIYTSEFLSVAGVGVPLQSGAVGSIINVRNPDTGVVVKARVAEDRTLVVEVP